MSKRYKVVSRKHSGTVEFSERADRAVAKFGSQSKEVPGEKAGSALWEAMRAGGVTQQEVNGFAVFEDQPDGIQIGSVIPVLEGARAVQLILYRADRDASAFRSLGTRQRIGDGLDVVFEKLKGELVLPHKP